MGEDSTKRCFLSAEPRKSEIKAVPSGGPEASLPAHSGSWRLLASHCRPEHHCSSASIIMPPFHLSSPLFFRYKDI